MSKTKNNQSDQSDQADHSPALIQVRVGKQAIFEGEHLPPGSVFETTPERAAALGGLVEAV